MLCWVFDCMFDFALTCIGVVEYCLVCFACVLCLRLGFVLCGFT